MTTIPTLQQLNDAILSNLEAQFDVSVNPFGQAFLTALAGVLAGVMWLAYIFLGAIQANAWVDTCDLEMLLRFGIIILSRYPFTATPGQYTLSVTGTAGAVIPANTVYKSDDSAESAGMLFMINEAYVMTGSGDVVTVTALTGGLVSRLAVADTLTLTAPVTNVNAGAAVTAETVVPINAETNAGYRTKIIEKVQLTAGSWSAADYRLAGVGVTGLQQVYAYKTSGQNCEMDVYLQGEVAGSPIDGAIITAYETALELVRPAQVFQVNYYASAIKNVDIVIVMGTFATFTTAQKAAVMAALTNFVNGVTPFIAAADNIANRNDVIATYNLNSVISGAVPGSGFSGVTFEVATVGVTLWQADNGNIPYLNSVTYA